MIMDMERAEKIGKKLICRNRLKFCLIMFFVHIYLWKDSLFSHYFLLDSRKQKHDNYKETDKGVNEL